VGLAPRGLICKAGRISALSGPAVVFENILDVDQFARIFGDMEANRVGYGRRGKLFATMASKPKIADIAHACLIRLDWGLQRASGRATFSGEGFT